MQRKDCEANVGMFMKPGAYNAPMAGHLQRWVRRFLKMNAKLISKFPDCISSDTARAASRTPGLLESQSLFQEIISALRVLITLNDFRQSPL